MFEYSWFMNCIRERQDSGQSRDEAIIGAMKDAGQKGIMTEFLREHGSEVSNMLYTQFNMEDALEVRGEEKFAEGKADAVIEFLRVMGPVPDSLVDRIKSEKDLQVLSGWIKAAALAESIEEFEAFL